MIQIITQPKSIISQNADYCNVTATVSTPDNKLKINTKMNTYF